MTELVLKDSSIFALLYFPQNSLLLLIIHLFYGSCQTSKYHYFLQTKYTNRVYNGNARFSDGFVGRWKVWDDNLILNSEYDVKDNQFNGIYKGYYSDGTLKEIRNYKNNKLQGEKIGFFENGSLKIKDMWLYGD